MFSVQLIKQTSGKPGVFLLSYFCNFVLSKSLIMKLVNYIAAVLLTATTLSAQEVKLKKDIVYVNNAATYSFVKKAMGNELYIFKLTTEEEFVHIFVDNNKTESKVDDSKKIIFTQQNTIITSKNFRGRDFEFLISLLIQEKVIDMKGEINADNLIRFKAKYNEGNVNQTMMR